MDRQQEFVLRTLEERQIRFVRLWFTDVLGTLKSVAVAPAELDGAFEEGIGFDGSAIEGFARASESDMLARPGPGDLPDPARARRSAAPTRRGCSATSRCPTARRPGPTRGTCCAARCPRRPSAGFTFYTHPEIEFFLLKNRPTDGSEPQPIDTGGYFDMTSHDIAHDFRRAAVGALEALGHLGRVQPPRGRARASRRSTCATPTRCRWPTTS